MTGQQIDPRALLDVTQLMVRDLDGRIRFWSSGAERLYGWPREEALGRISHRLLLTQFPKPLLEIEAELLREGHWQGELRHTTRGGKEVCVASYWVLQRDEAGRPAAIAEVNNDITALVQAEEARARLEIVAESLDDAIIAKDLEGVVTAWNQAAERMYGYAAHEIIGQHISRIIPSDRLAEEAAIDRLTGV